MRGIETISSRVVLDNEDEIAVGLAAAIVFVRPELDYIHAEHPATVVGVTRRSEFNATFAPPLQPDIAAFIRARDEVTGDEYKFVRWYYSDSLSPRFGGTARLQGAPTIAWRMVEDDLPRDVQQGWLRLGAFPSHCDHANAGLVVGGRGSFHVCSSCLVAVVWRDGAWVSL